jgi:carbonic anhydrase
MAAAASPRALQDQRVGLADNWLNHLHDVHSKHDARLAVIPDMPQRIDRLCELNVIEQVSNVCHTTVVRDAWERGQALAVHGWVYGLKDGLVRDLDTTVTHSKEVSVAYGVALAAL